MSGDGSIAYPSLTGKLNMDVSLKYREKSAFESSYLVQNSRRSLKSHNFQRRRKNMMITNLDVEGDDMTVTVKKKDPRSVAELPKKGERKSQLSLRSQWAPYN